MAAKDTGGPLAYFCVDIETSGPVPGHYNLLSIGCVACRPVSPGGRLAPGDELYLELRPVAPGFEAEAMAVNGLDPARLAREGLEPKEAMRRLAEFVEARLPEGGRAIFVGHNAPFDWSFVNYGFHEAGMSNPFGYSALDSKALAMGTLSLRWPDTNKETLERLLGLPPQDRTRVHRADYDARYQALIFCGLIDRLIERGIRP